MEDQRGGAARATIRDVAARAGVSVATVSRVLNGAGAGVVSGRARGLVEQAILDLEFEPSTAARALALRRSRTIGILTLTEVFSPASLSFELQRAAQRAGYTVTVATVTSHEPAAVTASALHAFREVEGLVVLAPTRESEQLLSALGPCVPTIVVEGSGRLRDASIAMDQSGGAATATEHLIAQGARRIAHIGGPEGWASAESRATGWRDTLRRHGLTEPPMIRGDWTTPSGYLAATELLRSGRPDAVFVANDLMAIGAMSAFADLGVEVPADVLVVGFDNIQASGYLIPKLSTVQQDFRDLALQAIDDLVRLMADGPAAAAHRLLPVELIVRASSTRGGRESTQSQMKEQARGNHHAVDRS